MAEANWYVVHTYSGYENKVKANIEKTIENRHLQEEILEVRVPLEDVQETKSNGDKKTVTKKILPGYVLIKMVMNDDTWYVVEGHANRVKVDFGVGDTVVAISGAWQDSVGIVQRLDDSKQTVRVAFEMFGRETPVEIAYSDVRKV